MYRFVIKNTDIAKIADSGQCFSIVQVETGFYYVLSRDLICAVSQDGADIIVECDEKHVDYWKNYFDADNPVYERFLAVSKGETHVLLKNAIEYGKGLRILNQDPFECLISFIISQRKSIPAIKTSINQLSMKYGKKQNFLGVEYYSFPSPEELVYGYEKDFYEDCGLGYREGYVYDTSKKMLSDEPTLRELRNSGYRESMSYLLRLKGVGEKVANCVCLYSLGKIDAFPVDVWMDRLLNQFFTTEDLINLELNYSGMKGLLQLYMFYYGRNNI